MRPRIRMHPRRTFLAQPFRDFKEFGDDQRICALGDGHHIRNVIVVPPSELKMKSALIFVISTALASGLGVMNG